MDRDLSSASEAPLESSPPTWQTWAVWLLCLFALTYFQCRAMNLIETTYVDPTTLNFRASWGVVTGHPEWTHYQNRIAGPFLVLGLSKLTGLSYALCHKAFVFLVVYLANLTAFVLLSRILRNRHAVYTFVLLTAASYAGVQKFGFNQDWDVIDFITMFIFAYGAFFGMSLAGLITLFFAQLLNKESAAFIALWIVIDALFPLGQIFSPRALGRIALGIGLFAVGSGWTHFIREKLILAKPDESRFFLYHGEQIMIYKNVYDFFHPGFTAWMMEAILVALVVRYVWYKGLASLHVQKMCLFLFCYIASIFVLGMFTETRDWFELVPFMIFLYLLPLGLARRHELP